MRTFSCQCGNVLHFENTVCLKCGRQVAYDPAVADFVTLPPKATPEGPNACAQRTVIACNWTAMPGATLCTSCASTRTIPNLELPINVARLSEIETAKHRVIRSLIHFDLWSPVGSQNRFKAPPLAFDFLEPLPGGPPVMTGHADGLITLNVSEVDNDQRERARESFSEPYRTVLGHLRHEVGHYFWDVLVKDQPAQEEFRRRFGDERADYQQALARHYASGPLPGWQSHFISAYATMHPWEDWAETWAHFMHRHATLETAEDLDLHSCLQEQPLDPRPFEGVFGASREEAADFAAATSRWLATTVLANELTRSMGQPDAYPFALPETSLIKLFFIDRVVAKAAREAPEDAGGKTKEAEKGAEAGAGR